MMENMLSGILAIIIALTSMCGGLMNSGAEQPFSADISMNVDGDVSVLGVPGQSEEVTAAVTKLLSVLSIRLAADTNVGQLQVSLDGNPVSSLSVQKQEGGWAAVSTLFPATKLTVKDETLASLTAQQGASMPALPADMDQAALQTLFQGSVDELTEAFKQKAGEPETGSFTVGGTEFTQKTPYSITTKEALTLVITAAKKILNDENIAPLFSQYGGQFSPESLDETLENLQKQDESELPVLSLAEYGNEAGDSAFELRLQQDGKETVSVLSVTSGQVTKVTVAVMDQADAVLVLDEENKQYDLDLSMHALEGVVNVAGSLKIQDESSDLEVALTMPSAGAKPTTMKFTAKITAEAPVFEAAEGLNEVALETLMKDEEAANTLNTEITQAMMLMIVKISKDYPELVTMMAPSGT